jgi:hypothetical protein
VRKGEISHKILKSSLLLMHDATVPVLYSNRGFSPVFRSEDKSYDVESMVAKERIYQRPSYDAVECIEFYSCSVWSRNSEPSPAPHHA